MLNKAALNGGGKQSRLLDPRINDFAPGRIKMGAGGHSGFWGFHFWEKSKRLRKRVFTVFIRISRD